MLFIYFLFMYRYPDFFSKVLEESQEIKYMNSRLKSIDRKTLINRLESLMDRDGIYRENTLNLEKVSDKLNITAPQLSELLNTHYNTNFNHFINSYRIEEVKKILESEPGANILQTAFDCGFNSKTTFNRTFRNYSGMSPTQYNNQKRSN